MTMTDVQIHYSRRDIQGSRVGEDLVIFDDRVGKYFATGPVGADIWDMLATPHTFDAICQRLLAMYDIDEATCRTQVKEFIARMEAVDLIRS